MLVDYVLEVVEEGCDCEDYEVGTVCKFFLLFFLFPLCKFCFRDIEVRIMQRLSIMLFRLIV